LDLVDDLYIFNLKWINWTPLWASYFGLEHPVIIWTNWNTSRSTT